MNPVWYAPGDDRTCMERVVVISTITFPTWGRYILYKQIDWPDSENIHPLCTHESTFLRLYTPQDSDSCAIQPPGNSFSKISLPEQQSWYMRLRIFWERLTSPKPNF